MFIQLKLKKNKFTAFQQFLFSYLTQPGDVKFFCLRRHAESIDDPNDLSVTRRIDPDNKKEIDSLPQIIISINVKSNDRNDV